MRVFGNYLASVTAAIRGKKLLSEDEVRRIVRQEVKTILQEEAEKKSSKSRTMWDLEQRQ